MSTGTAINHQPHTASHDDGQLDFWSGATDFPPVLSPAQSATSIPKCRSKLRKPPTLIVSPLDCLNQSELAVYEALVFAFGERDPVADHNSCLVVQVGRATLEKNAGKCKRTIKRAIANLIRKRFVAMLLPRNGHKQESMTYRIYSVDAIAEILRASGMTHWRHAGGGRIVVSIPESADESQPAPKRKTNKSIVARPKRAQRSTDNSGQLSLLDMVSKSSDGWLSTVAGTLPEIFEATTQ